MKKRTRVILLSASAFGGLVILSKLFDFPAIKDEHPQGLGGIADLESIRFYSYSLGGYIDEESLWRIDGNQTEVDALISGLGLQRATAIPREFWRFRPYYWPKKSFPDAVGYRSQFFEASNRGQDGLHYFVVHDPSKNRAFVWVKDNF